MLSNLVKLELMGNNNCTFFSFRSPRSVFGRLFMTRWEEILLIQVLPPALVDIMKGNVPNV